MARLTRALLLAGAAAVMAAQNGTQAQPDGLNSLMVKAGKLYFGTAADVNSFNDTEYMAIVSNKNDFGMITADNSITWDFTEAVQGKFTYTNADRVVAKAKQNGQMMRCHALVWHKALPSWGKSAVSLCVLTLLHPGFANSLPCYPVAEGAWTNETLIEVMETHITNVVSHFKGACYSWNVVNEAIEDVYNPGYRETVFSKVIGGDYIPIAFSAAAAADKDAKLYYSDYGMEGPTTEKLNAALVIVDDIQSRGIRIDGVGLAGHNVVGATPSRESLAATLRNFTALGLEVAWTEVEIRHTQLPPNATALQQQAQDYAAIVGSCLDVKECVGVTVWQFTDKYNWVPQSLPGEGDACLWSADYQRRPAYDAIMDLLRGTINGTLKLTPAPPPTSQKSAAGRLSMGTIGGLLGAALSAWLLL